MISRFRIRGRSDPFFISVFTLCFCSVLIAGCGVQLPAWTPDFLRPHLVSLFGFVDASKTTKPQVSSEEIDRSLPSNSVGVNLQILKEMYRVVFLRETAGPAEYGALLSVLGQGASFEGVYNGLVANSEYRKLEAEARRVGPLTIRLFAEELVYLQMELPREERTPIVPDLAKPLLSIEFPTEGSADGTSSPSPTESPARPAAQKSMTPQEEALILRDEIERVFLEANLFTMKRVLCTEVFKVFAAKKQSRPDLASWFGKWAARVAGRGVDFQYEERNSTDPQTYDDWAFGATTDRIQWEVLYRLHRLLNVSEGKK